MGGAAAGPWEGRAPSQQEQEMGLPWKSTQVGMCLGVGSTSRGCAGMGISAGALAPLCPFTLADLLLPGTWGGREGERSGTGVRLSLLSADKGH